MLFTRREVRIGKNCARGLAVRLAVYKKSDTIWHLSVTKREVKKAHVGLLLMGGIWEVFGFQEKNSVLEMLLRMRRMRLSLVYRDMNKLLFVLECRTQRLDSITECYLG